MFYWACFLAAAAVTAAMKYTKYTSMHAFILIVCTLPYKHHYRVFRPFPLKAEATRRTT